MNYVTDLFNIKTLKERSIRAFVSFYRNTPDYDHKKFTTKFKYSLPLLEDCMETTQFYNKFVEIYNK